MASKEAFDESLKRPNIALILSGITIYPTDNKLFIYFLKYIFYFNIPWLYTDVLGEFYWLVQGAYEGKSVSELSFIAPCVTICLLATAKSTPLYMHRHAVIEIITKLRNLHPEEHELKKRIENTGRDDEDSYLEDSKREDEIKTVKDSMNILNIVVGLFFYSSSMVVVSFTTLPILSMAYDYYTEGETELKLPFLVKYFFDPFTKTMWPIMYFHQVWSITMKIRQISKLTKYRRLKILPQESYLRAYTSLFIAYIAAFNVFGADALLCSFCTYIKMHFELLCNRFEDLVSSSAYDTEQRMLQLVKRHQELIHMIDQIDEMYSRSTLFNIITSSILICLSGFNVMILEDRVSVVAFLTFLSMSLTQISVLCLFGDMLMDSSSKLYQSIYNSRWYEAEERMKKNILFCLMRAQRPCKLTAWKFANLNLTSLTTILSRSWSLFALLQRMYK